MFHAWLANIGGRVKSDLRFSKNLVYNTFPLPELTGPQRVAIRKAATHLLATREEYPRSTLADLYDPLVTPPDIRSAHHQLDQAVDKVFRPRKKRYRDDTERLADLLARHEKLVGK